MKPILVLSGKRKSAVARVNVVPGSGAIYYNGSASEGLSMFHKLALEEPLVLGKKAIGAIEFDFHIKTKGGGKEGQLQAARLAIAKSLVAVTQSLDLKKVYLKYDRSLLVADTRRKEAYKPGDSKARAKRQKSYR